MCPLFCFTSKESDMTAKDQKLTIACKSSLTLSAAAMGLKKDKKVSPFEKVTVPKSYGDHLISDGFAMLYEDYKKAEAKNAAATKAAETKTKAATTKAAKTQKAEAIETAEGDLTAAKELLTEAGDDAAAKEAAETAVKDAETALNALTAN